MAQVGFADAETVNKLVGFDMGSYLRLIFRSQLARFLAPRREFLQP
jgi:hypothetical protein